MADISDYDIILGERWCLEHQAVIDHADESLYAKTAQGFLVRLDLTEEPTERKSSKVKGPTSPRIVTGRQHSKHTWMRPIVLSNTFIITTHLLPYCPLSMSKSSSLTFHEKVPKKDLGNNI